MVPMADVKKGDAIAVGHGGIRVLPLESARNREIFSFMVSEASSERPKRLVIEEVARQMWQIRSNHGRILVVAGPALFTAELQPTWPESSVPALSRCYLAGMP